MVAPRESRWARLVSGVVAAAAAAAGLADTKPSDNRKAARTGSTTHRRCLFVPKDPFISTYLLRVRRPTRPRDRNRPTEDARAFCRRFFRWYNGEHHHNVGSQSMLVWGRPW